MIAPEYFNNHIAVEGEIVVKRVPNDTGSVVVWNSVTNKLSIRTHAEIVSDLKILTTHTEQNVEGTKWFRTAGGSAYLNHRLRIISEDGSNPGMVFYKSGANAGTLQYDGSHYIFTNSDTDGYGLVLSDGYKKSGSNDNHILLGGGGHKAVSDFASSADLPNLVTKNTEQTITADKVFKKITTTDWVIPKSLAFPDASGSIPNYIGFYMWNSQWQVNWRDSSNTYAYPLLDIDGLSKNATFYGNTTSPKLTTPGGNSDQWNEAYHSIGNYVTLNTDQGVTGKKTFYNQGQNFGELPLVVWGNNGSKGGIGFVKGGTDSAILNFDTEFHFTNNNNDGYKFINAAGVKAAGSDDNHVLLGGGGHKSLDELVTTNTNQDITGAKRFFTKGNTSFYTDNALMAFSNDGSWPAMTFYRNVDSAGQIIFYGNYFGFLNESGNQHLPIKTGGVIKDGFDDNYFLLAGGGTQLKTDFALKSELSNYYKKFTSGPYSGVSTNYPFSFLNVDAAQKVYMGGLLISDNYGDNVNIPPSGAFILGLISTANNGNSAQWNHAYNWAVQADLTYLKTNYLSQKPLIANNAISDGTMTNYMPSDDPSKPLEVNDGSLLTLNYSSIWSTQLLGDWRTRELYYRTQENGTWKSFVKIHHSGNFNPDDKVNKAGDTMTGGLTINSPDSAGSLNLGTLPTNYKLFLANSGDNVARYGTVFWTESDGIGYIQQQRADGQQNAYRLSLQPYGGELFYNNSEVATRNWTNENFIPKTHHAYEITASNVYSWSGYLRHDYNMLIQPNQIGDTSMQFGFGSWNNNNSYPYADYLHFGGYADSSGGNQNLIMFSKIGFGLRQWQGTKGSPANYTSFVDYWNTNHFSQANVNSWNNMVSNYVTLNTNQNISASKSFYNATPFKIKRIDYKSWVFHKPVSNNLIFAPSLSNDAEDWDWSNQITFNDNGTVNSNGYIKDDSDNSFVLLGGGDHKKINELEINSLINYNYYQGQDLNNYLEAAKLKFIPAIPKSSGTPNLFPTDNDANALLSISTWSDANFGHELGFSGNGNIYHRYKLSGIYNNWGNLWTNNNFNPDDKVNKSGDTITGVLNLKYLNSLALNGGQIINAANTNQLYIGNPSVENVYFESDNNNLFHNRAGYGVGIIWDQHNFNPDLKHSIDLAGSINNGSSARTNKSWFDYNWAETGQQGSVISFSGLNGNYSTELFGSYNNPDKIGIRTKNGDNNTWNSAKWLWHSENFNPAQYATQTWVNSLLTSNRKKTYFFDVTAGLAVYRLYLPQDTGTYGLTIKIRSDYANYDSTGLTEFKINYGKSGNWIFHQDFYCSALLGNVRGTIYLQPQILYDSSLDKPYINVHKFVPLLNPINLEVEVVTKTYNANLNDASLTFIEDAGATVLDLRNKNENFLTSGANYKLDWDGVSDHLYRDDVLLGYLLTSQNISSFDFVTYSNLNVQLANYATLNGAQTFTNTNTFAQSPVIPDATLGTHAVNLNQLNIKANANGLNATAAWVDSSHGLQANPTINGKMYNAQGQSDLRNATSGSVAGYINEYGIDSGNPGSNWFYRMKFLHNNAAGYYGEIAIQMTGGNGFFYKRYENGTDFGWIQTWDKHNLPQASIDAFNAAYGWGNHADAGYYKINNNSANSDAELIPNGNQVISTGNSGTNFDGELSNKILEGTFANFNANDNTSKTLGFTLFAPTSTGQGIYYKTWYGGSTPWRRLIDSQDIQNYVTLNTPQTIIQEKTFSSGLGLTGGKSIFLKGFSDIAHRVQWFDDDSDGFAVSSAFSVKPYNDLSVSWFTANSGGAYSNGNRIWDTGNLTPIKLDGGKSSVLLSDIGFNNLNDLQQTGFFKGSNLINAPLNSPEWFFVICEYHYTGWISQTATSYGTGSVKAGRTFKRSFTEGTTWTDWNEVITTLTFNPDHYQPIGSYLTTNTTQTIGATKTIGFQNTIYSGWDRSSVTNPQMGPFSLLNLALQGAYPLYGDEEFRNGSNNIGVYNNYGNGTVTMIREAASDLPNRSGIQLRFNYNGSGATPGLGGFILGFNARPNAIFIQKFTAKLPIGYAFNNAENYMGDNASVNWLTSRAGTGKWETYVRAVICGTGTSFGNGGHVYVEGPDTAMEFSLAFAEIYEINSSVFSRIKESFYAKNETVHFNGVISDLITVGDSYAQKRLLSISWDGTNGDQILLRVPGNQDNGAYLRYSQSGTLNGNIGLFGSDNLTGGQMMNAKGDILYLGNHALPNMLLQAVTNVHFNYAGTGSIYTFNINGVYLDRNINFNLDNSGINFYDGGKIYKKAGGGIYINKGNNGLDPRVENADGSQSWAIFHEGNHTPFRNLRGGAVLEEVSESGIYRQEGATSGFNYTTTLNMNSSDGRQQLTIERSGSGMKFRGSYYGSGNQGWSDWKDVIHSGNLTIYLNSYGFVTQSALNSQLLGYATLNGVQTFTNTNTFTSSPVIPNGTLGTHAVNKNQIELNAGAEGENGQQLTISGNNSVNLTNFFLTSRSGSRNPDDIAPDSTSKRVRFDFAYSTAAGLGGSGNYAGIMTYSPWDGTSASTGDSSYQLAFANQTGVDGAGIPMLKIRKGINGSWTSLWYKLWTEADFSSTNIQQWNHIAQFGLQLNQSFSNTTGYNLMISDDYFGNESGLADAGSESFVAGRVNEYYKYGSRIKDGFEGINYHLERRTIGIGGEADENKVSVRGCVKAIANFKSEEERADTIFIPDGNLASLRDEIVNDESEYAIRLDPHHYEIDSSGNLEVNDRNRLIHIIGEEIKMSVNFKEIYPKQQIVIYNFDQKDYPMTVLVQGKPVYSVKPGAFLRLYVTKSLRIIAESQLPCEFIW